MLSIIYDSIYGYGCCFPYYFVFQSKYFIVFIILYTQIIVWILREKTNCITKANYLDMYIKKIQSLSLFLSLSLSHTHTHTHARARRRTHARPHTHTHTRTHTQTYTQTHTKYRNTHTNKHTRERIVILKLTHTDICISFKLFFSSITIHWRDIIDISRESQKQNLFIKTTKVPPV